MAVHWYKDPDSKIQFKFDWAPSTNGTGDSDWLDTSTSPIETISSQTLTIESPGVTIESSNITDSSTTVSLLVSGGTAGETYTITNQITTSTGQIAERTAYLHIGER